MIRRGLKWLADRLRALGRWIDRHLKNDEDDDQWLDRQM